MYVSRADTLKRARQFVAKFLGRVTPVLTECPL
jgi:hypothetical protein